MLCPTLQLAANLHNYISTGSELFPTPWRSWKINMVWNVAFQSKGATETYDSHCDYGSCLMPKWLNSVVAAKFPKLQDPPSLIVLLSGRM